MGNPSFFFEGSIQENFAEYRKYRDLQPYNQKEICTYLKICIAEFPMDTLCATMSSGERQRVFTAICLSFKPKVLLLDEPTSALDDMTANAMMVNIIAFCKDNNITLIVVSHNKALAETYADNIILLVGGGRHE